MNEMVERVARAIALADLDDETAAIVDLDAHMVHVGDHYEELARATIEAMREPTESMRIAAITTPLPAGAGDAPLYEKIWRAMIDAALADPS